MPCKSETVGIGKRRGVAFYHTKCNMPHENKYGQYNNFCLNRKRSLPSNQKQKNSRFLFSETGAVVLFLRDQSENQAVTIVPEIQNRHRYGKTDTNAVPFHIISRKTTQKRRAQRNRHSVIAERFAEAQMKQRKKCAGHAAGRTRKSEQGSYRTRNFRNE